MEFSINEIPIKRWGFLCENGCGLKYTIKQEPFDSEQVKIMLEGMG